MSPADLGTTLYSALRADPPQIPAERQLCDAIEAALSALGYRFEREFRLNGRDRPDFVVGMPVVAVEVKIKGSLAEVTRQIHRYAQHPDVTGILVVTTRADHRRLPDTLSGKPVAVCYLDLYL